MKKNIKLTVGLVCLLFATYIHAANLDIIVSAIPSEKGKVAIGISAYDINEVKKILGKKSKEILKILGYEGRDEIIHKDDLVQTI